jgi:hypothetical protein
MKHLIGFAGLIGSGKSTAASYLVQNHDYHLRKFAGPLKAMCAALGLSDEEINGSLKEKPCALLDGQTPRWAQQTLGTEWGRVFISQNIWTNAWQRSIQGLDLVVSDDVRFPNEAKLIRELGGEVVMIVREGQKQGEHASEQFAFEPDLIVYNNGSITDLEQKIAGIIGARY